MSLNEGKSDHKLFKSLLVIDDQSDVDCDLAKVALATTRVVYFNSKKETLDTIIRKIRNAHVENLAPFQSVGFANHSSGRGKRYEVAYNLNIDINQYKSQETAVALQPLISVLISCVDKIDGLGRIDFFGKNLLSRDPAFCEALEIFYGFRFTATDDRTGEQVTSGDWVKKLRNSDIRLDYFSAKSLESYRGKIFAFPAISNPTSKKISSFVEDHIDEVPFAGTTYRGMLAISYATLGKTKDAKIQATNFVYDATLDVFTVSTGGIGGVTRVMYAGVQEVGKSAIKNKLLRFDKLICRKAVNDVHSLFKDPKPDAEMVLKKYFDKNTHFDHDELASILIEQFGLDPEVAKEMSDEELRHTAVVALHYDEQGVKKNSISNSVKGQENGVAK